MRTNVQVKEVRRTHEGARSQTVGAVAELRRSVMANMLFEGTFYESGEDVADRISSLIKKVSFEDAAEIAIDAREKMKLRHVPLLILCGILPLYNGRKVGDLVYRVVQRPDEMGELISLYWRGGKRPLAHQLKIGLARCFSKFSEYQLAKHDKPSNITLRDVMFLCHPKPQNDEQAALFKRIANKELATPDTWEVSLSGGADKKETFERLMKEKNLGALALLRNLRNMKKSGVDEKLIREALKAMDATRVLPFRFVAAANYAPHLEDALEEAMLRCLAEFPKLQGKTAIVVDNSGSMHGTPISSRSEMDRSDAACALAIMVREVCEQATVIAFSDEGTVVPNRRGFALRDAIKKTNIGWTDLGAAIRKAKSEGYDRIIVITDEQSGTPAGSPDGLGYIINIATYRNGIGYGDWLTINGWSESILDYIQMYENENRLVA